MSKFKSLGDVYSESRSYNYKDSTVIEREIHKIHKELSKAKEKLQNKSREVENALRLDMDVKAKGGWDRVYNRETSEERAEVKRLERSLNDALARYRTATNLENPSHPPTLSDEYEMMKRGEHRLTDNYGMITPMDHNYDIYKKLSPVAKVLYQDIREAGNKGEVIDFYQDKSIYQDYKGIRAKDLATVMKLALDYGYELSDQLYYSLEELSPQLAKHVNNYDGFEMSHKDNMRASHAHFQKIKNQFLIKYDGDEAKANRMTKLYRKRKQADSKLDQKYKD